MYSALIHHNKLVPIFRQIRWISKPSKTSMLSEYAHSVQFPVSASGYSDRIINERHPAATLLANLGSMIIQRQLDVDTESENRYKITTWQGTLLASIVEKNLGSGNGKAWKAKPAFASFIASVFDDTETELLRVGLYLQTDLPILNPYRFIARSRAPSQEYRSTVQSEAKHLRLPPAFPEMISRLNS